MQKPKRYRAQPVIDAVPVHEKNTGTPYMVTHFPAQPGNEN
jgi:hypothetical protein